MCQSKPKCISHSKPKCVTPSKPRCVTHLKPDVLYLNSNVALSKSWCVTLTKARCFILKVDVSLYLKTDVSLYLNPVIWVYQQQGQEMWTVTDWHWVINWNSKQKYLSPRKNMFTLFSSSNLTYIEHRAIDSACKSIHNEG